MCVRAENRTGASDVPTMIHILWSDRGQTPHKIADHRRTISPGSWETTNSGNSGVGLNSGNGGHSTLNEAANDPKPTKRSVKTWSLSNQMLDGAVVMGEDVVLISGILGVFWGDIFCYLFVVIFSVSQLIFLSEGFWKGHRVISSFTLPTGPSRSL